MTRLLAAALAAAFFAVTPARAQIDGSIDPRQAVTGFNTSEILAAARALGMTAASQRLSDGTEVLQFQTANVVFFAQRTVCSQSTCTGLAFYAQYNPGFDLPLDAFNAFNSSQGIISAAKVQNSAVLKRYLIADYGAYLGNIASDIFNFEKRAKSFVDFASGGGTTVSFRANEAGASPKIASSFASAGPLDEDFHLRMRAEFDGAATAPPP
jgi:hypothetical protein